MLIVFGRDLTALTKIISGLVVARALVIHNVICTIFADSFDVQAIDIHGIEIAGRGLDTAIIRDNFRDGQLMGIIIGIGGGVVQILLTITYGVGLFAQFPAVVIIGVLAHDGRIAILIIAFNHVPVVVENLSVQIVLLAIEVGGHFQDIAVLVQLFDDNGVHITCFVDFTHENLIAVLIVLVNGNNAIFIISTVVHRLGAQQQVLRSSFVYISNLGRRFLRRSLLNHRTFSRGGRSCFGRGSGRLLSSTSGKHQGCGGCHGSGSGQVFVSHVLSFSFVWIVFAQILQCSICCTTPIVSGSHIPASKQGLQNSNYKPSAFGWAAFFF